MKNIIIVSAHPDDESIGAGGTLFKHLNSNDNIFWIVFTKPSEKTGYSMNFIKKRNSEIKEVIRLLKIKKYFNLGYETTTLQPGDKNILIGKINRIFKEIMPNIIYLPNRSDAHSDHRIVFESVYACTKSFRNPTIEKVLMYECISETEFSAPLIENIFLPNYFIDISNYIDLKISLLKIFKSEFSEHPFPRSFDNIISLAKFRGASSGVHYAEAFQALKIIEK